MASADALLARALESMGMTVATPAASGLASSSSSSSNARQNLGAASACLGPRDRRPANATNLEQFFDEYENAKSSHEQPEVDKRLLLYLKEEFCSTLQEVFPVKKVKEWRSPLVVIRVEPDGTTRGVLGTGPTGRFVDRGAHWLVQYGEVIIIQDTTLLKVRTSESGLEEEAELESASAQVQEASSSSSSSTITNQSETEPTSIEPLLMRIPLPLSTKNVSASRPPAETDMEYKPSVVSAYTVKEDMKELVGDWIHSLLSVDIDALFDLASDSAAEAIAKVAILAEMLSKEFPSASFFIRRCEEHQLAITGIRTMESLADYMRASLQKANRRLLCETRAMRTSQQKCQTVCYEKWRSDVHVDAGFANTWTREKQIWGQFLADLNESQDIRRGLEGSALVSSNAVFLDTGETPKKILISSGDKEKLVQTMCRMYRALSEPRDSRWLTIAPASARRCSLFVAGSEGILVLGSTYYLGKNEPKYEAEALDDYYAYFILGQALALQPVNKLERGVLRQADTARTVSDDVGFMQPIFAECCAWLEDVIANRLREYCSIITYPRQDLEHLVPSLESGVDWAATVQAGEVAWRVWESPRDEHVTVVRRFLRGMLGHLQADGATCETIVAELKERPQKALESGDLSAWVLNHLSRRIAVAKDPVARMKKIVTGLCASSSTTVNVERAICSRKHLQQCLQNEWRSLETLDYIHYRRLFVRVSQRVTDDIAEEAEAKAGKARGTAVKVGTVVDPDVDQRMRRTSAYHQAMSRCNVGRSVAAITGPTEITAADRKRAREINRKLQQKRERTPLILPVPFKSQRGLGGSSTAALPPAAIGAQEQPWEAGLPSSRTHGHDHRPIEDRPLQMMQRLLSALRRRTQAAYVEDKKGAWKEEAKEMKRRHFLSYPAADLNLIDRLSHTPTEFEVKLPQILKARRELLNAAAKAKRGSDGVLYVNGEADDEEAAVAVTGAVALGQSQNAGKEPKKKRQQRTFRSLVVDGNPRRVEPHAELPQVSDIQNLQLLALKCPSGTYLVTTVLGGTNEHAFIACKKFTDDYKRLDKSCFYFSKNHHEFSNSAYSAGTTVVHAAMWSRYDGLTLGPSLDVLTEYKGGDLNQADAVGGSAAVVAQRRKKVIPDNKLLIEFEQRTDPLEKALLILAHNSKMATNQTRKRPKVNHGDVASSETAEGKAIKNNNNDSSSSKRKKVTNSKDNNSISATTSPAKKQIKSSPGKIDLEFDFELGAGASATSIAHQHAGAVDLDSGLTLNADDNEPSSDEESGMVLLESDAEPAPVALFDFEADDVKAKDRPPAPATLGGSAIALSQSASGTLGRKATAPTSRSKVVEMEEPVTLTRVKTSAELAEARRMKSIEQKETADAGAWEFNEKYHGRWVMDADAQENVVVRCIGKFRVALQTVLEEDKAMREILQTQGKQGRRFYSKRKGAQREDRSSKFPVIYLEMWCRRVMFLLCTAADIDATSFIKKWSSVSGPLWVEARGCAASAVQLADLKEMARVKYSDFRWVQQILRKHGLRK
ncbi:unnamed protein product [Amoebophrya sp. A25]|nr:unnamed protein product [Amoebophrya sp. A25]|eukprot:GSA25T00015856001.1